ncbi:hypothetical protein HORIV_00150 [Vreelandella olivaria]|uniref:Glycine--tRNA ligase alpha subunit n=1 Tax=Vreelandella olivaria TaxID=390919 RepID=A0ABN5WKP0_9GAMM|nr:hypothetical protein HORIV_00150 [Halomonas olivaria]
MLAYVPITHLPRIVYLTPYEFMANGAFRDECLDKPIDTRCVDLSSLILALQQYWAEQGCVILQPLDMEVGAGTFHPATFLRAIGPESWNAAYVQPSGVRLMAAMAKILTAFSTTTSSR